MLGLSVQQCACLVFLVVLAVCSGFTDAMARSRSVSEVSEVRRLRHHRAARESHRKCPEINVLWKAWRAGTVAHATAQSTNCKNRDECEVVFKVLKWFKREPSGAAMLPKEDTVLRLSLRKNNSKYCEYDQLATRTQPLVRTKIETSKEYILFLNISGPHKFFAAFAPAPIERKGILKAMDKVTNETTFSTKPVTINTKASIYKVKQRKYVCKVDGFPIPIILWKRNNTILLHNTSFIQIIQKKRKISTLKVLRGDTGQYTCVAKAANGQETSYVISRSTSRPKTHTSSGSRKHTTSRPKTYRPYGSAKHRTFTPTTLTTAMPGEPCKGRLKEEFCYNGGTCFSTLGENDCICPQGYTGHRCDRKTSNKTNKKTPDSDEASEKSDKAG
ncbi:uncharacterized protein LOC123013375 isoform X2 [Tribolium madens]|uniref:uncharacterized protein LOC123013375 isoform X2 n=1 Tax=Tribolium madens TaxID=41895 RepID=UPI001CF72706|nr:uncharacterized protein LOC123013375 isoform X2 [Tribolium madens]